MLTLPTAIIIHPTFEMTESRRGHSFAPNHLANRLRSQDLYALLFLMLKPEFLLLSRNIMWLVSPTSLKLTTLCSSNISRKCRCFYLRQWYTLWLMHSLRWAYLTNNCRHPTESRPVRRRHRTGRFCLCRRKQGNLKFWGAGWPPTARPRFPDGKPPHHRCLFRIWINRMNYGEVWSKPFYEKNSSVNTFGETHKWIYPRLWMWRDPQKLLLILKD